MFGILPDQRVGEGEKNTRDKRNISVPACFGEAPSSSNCVFVADHRGSGGLIRRSGKPKEMK